MLLMSLSGFTYEVNFTLHTLFTMLDAHHARGPSNETRAYTTSSLSFALSHSQIQAVLISLRE